jgi:nucleotide-binding universal stress UspA family protein
MGPVDTLGISVRPLFRESAQVARTINRTAAEEHSDLIVLSSRGRTSFATFRQSVAEQTLRDCRVPLLILKHFGTQLRLPRALLEQLLLDPQDDPQFG